MCTWPDDIIQYTLDRIWEAVIWQHPEGNDLHKYLPPWIITMALCLRLVCFILVFLYLHLLDFCPVVPRPPVSVFLRFEWTLSPIQNRAAQSSMYAVINLVPVSLTSPTTLHFPNEPNEAITLLLK